jgi:hypothetical protein
MEGYRNRQSRQGDSQLINDEINLPFPVPGFFCTRCDYSTHSQNDMNAHVCQNDNNEYASYRLRDDMMYLRGQLEALTYHEEFCPEEAPFNLLTSITRQYHKIMERVLGCKIDEKYE